MKHRPQFGSVTVTLLLVLSFCSPFSVAPIKATEKQLLSRPASPSQLPTRTPLVSPGFVSTPTPVISPRPLMTPTPPDGARQPNQGPYVPPAMRTDHVKQRGITGRRVDPPRIELSAPGANLPDLNESRKIRKSPKTKRADSLVSSSGGNRESVDLIDEACAECKQRGPHNGRGVSRGSHRTSAPVQELERCADCDPSGGGGAGGSDPYFGTARTLPANETGDPGVTLGSRNFNWGLPLVSLPGRAGMDLSISLYYNSLVWTRQGNAIQYNADHGTPAPGFQLGLPRLQSQYIDADTGAWAYLMVTPSGGRVEMKQIGGTNTYESADSTYTQLTFSGQIPIVRATDGTQFIFETQVGAEWRCTRIVDRNGNYVSATYDSSNGHILTITDTLGRTLNFNYDGDNNLSTITQSWGGATHTWVTFVYTTVQMSFNFPGLSVFGAHNGSLQPVLQYIAFPENTSYHFDYNSYGQVYQIRHKAPDDHELEHTFYNFNTAGPQSDCPRFTERRDYAQYWNSGAEALTTYSVTEGATWTNPETSANETGTLVQQIGPDGTIYREYSHASGWDAGLTRLSEFRTAQDVKKKWISTSWTQDDTSLSFAQNPRVAELNVYDDAGNRKRTTIGYNQGYSLPTNIAEYGGAEGQTLLRSSSTSYRFDGAYIDRRIIGLPSESSVSDAAGNIVSRQVYHYDWDGQFFNTQQPATNYDAVNYPSTFLIGRGNLVAVRRYDCTNNATAYDEDLALWTQGTGYNMAGSVVFTFDGEGHRTSIGYSDNFSDGNNSRNTLAYATTVTDPDGYSSSAQYNFDFGAITNTHVPTSGVAPNITYLDVLREYDDFGRLERITNQTNNAYTHFVYETNANLVHTYQSIIDLNPANEFHSWQIFDGAGRLINVASDNPGSTGGYIGQLTRHDEMGRAKWQTNPTEITGGWVPAGDDAAGWALTYQTYDWQGRPTLTTFPDLSTRENSYGGCGCAGGDVMTAQDEKGRQRRFSKDTLGRLWRVEEMYWNTGNVYAATIYSYNARDQISDINQSGQHRTFEYDGHGRLNRRVTPEQGATTFSYFADDRTHVLTDARSVTTTYGYNQRHQITSLTYNVSADPTGQTTATANVSFAYDAAGNRTSMNDGLGSASYNFNSLGQMTSETRSFNGLGSYNLNYEYNLAGQLKKVTNPWGVEVSYGYDKAGRLTGVGGANYAGVTSYASSLSYRAFGAIKGMNYGDGHSLSTAYDNRLRPRRWDVPGVLGSDYEYNWEVTGRVSFARSRTDASLDRWYAYDAVGRLGIARSGAEARAANGEGWNGQYDGPYSMNVFYDVWGNITLKEGWGGENSAFTASYTNNRRQGSTYDAAGNVTNDGGQTFSYDATGQQTFASMGGGWGAAPAYQDNPIVVDQTVVKALHITELRAAINSLRNHLGRANYAWQYSATTNDWISANPIIEMRAALDEALGPPPAPGYAPGLTQGQPIKKDHIQELRNRVTTAWNAYSAAGLTQFYDGDGLRVKKTESGATTYYVRSSVLGGQVIAEVNGSAGWQRGFVYAGANLLAVQQGSVFWMHEDPVTKSKRVTDINGNIVSTIELDPWGGDTNRSSNAAFQPKRFTSYERDANQSDEAMFRRYNRWWSRFDQPDPYDGSYSIEDPQSLNRYAYVQNDPVNFVDPSGLLPCYDAWCGSGGGSGWGGGYAGGNGWGSSPRPGLSTIHGAEQRLHPLVISAGDFQENYAFHSLFTGWQFWFGFSPQQPRPARTPTPPLVANRQQRDQQRQFDDCAKNAWRAFRKGYLWESGRGAVGGVLLVAGAYVFIRGIPGAAPIGAIAAINAARAGHFHGIEGPYKAGVGAALSLGLPGAYMIGRSVQEQTKNIAARDAALENCNRKFPNANHSLSFLNF